jgi:hypothetical protein
VDSCSAGDRPIRARLAVLRRTRHVHVGLAALAITAGAAAAEPVFRDVAESWGLAFRHHHGGTGQRYMVETMVGGVAILDYDEDGDEDVFFVDGGALPGYTGEPPRSRLYRNEGRGRYLDVTERAKIDVAGYGCGAVAGDADGDGDLDLYVTAFGPNRLFLNLGDGSFREAGAEAGVADPRWSAGAAFGDADGDGDLDLYVANYVDFALDNHRFCGDRESGVRGYCTPVVYEPLPDRFYRNLGEGRFRDDTAAAGLVEPEGGGAGLGVVFADLTGDGHPDLYVANDLDPNFVFVNRGDGTFEDVSLLSGAGYSDTGKPEAGMGVDLADVDGNGLLDVAVTNFELETNALYLSVGGGLFRDARFAVGLAERSFRQLAFGFVFADFDRDGDEDAMIANGHVLDNPREMGSEGTYGQRNQVFSQGPPGRFREIEEAGLLAARPSRGLASGDLDGDGDLDAVVLNSNDVAEVYENLAEGGAWLLLDLRGGRNRWAIGAQLEIEHGGRRQLRAVRAGLSYLSHSALGAHFGLGEAREVERLRVRWPDGRRSELRSVPANRRLRLVASEGDGESP